MNKSGKRLTALTAVLLLAIGVSTPVSAAESKNAGIINALESITSTSKTGAKAVLVNAGEFREMSEGSAAFSSTYEGTEVRLPRTAADSIEFVTSRGSKFGLKMPFSTSSAAAEEIATGIVAYDNKNASATVPIAKTDGSIQLTTVIASPEAPTNYD